MEDYKNINVENINIVDKNGTVRMRLFNNDHIPPAIMDGKDILPGHRQEDPIAGLMFYNREGDECGGLIFGSKKDDEGNYESYASLTFDQYKQDQVVQMHYIDENGQRHYGFSVYDRPNMPLPDLMERTRDIQNSDLTDEELEKELETIWKGNTQRAFMGKNSKGEVTVQLSDSKGKPRIRTVVDENDIPRMEFLDGDGNVTYKIPPE
ncbi:hypothetical protein [Bacillus sp. AFS017336]|uniref:hypothetical protein n=1 Tax=Bacillus sp. AFS017336 TaxID=2033489 RepID=UPI000BF0D0B7|nr:hypothetical protein [Bacillus sp. AFS017336]PEL13739.1 hypothetical protein CN601_03235 [Bacillus sp. AFS017336]